MKISELLLLLEEAQRELIHMKNIHGDLEVKYGVELGNTGADQSELTNVYIDAINECGHMITEFSHEDVHHILLTLVN